MNPWIDLTVLIDEFYKVFPGDELIVFKNLKTVEKDKYHIKQITTNMHVGTHLDTKKHVFKDGDSLETIDFSKFIGLAYVIKPKIINDIIQTSSITLKTDNSISILILDLGWSKYLNTDKYYAYPKFQRSILNLLKRHNIQVLGLDIPSPEYENENFLQMHRDLLVNDIFIIENLTNLKSLNKIVNFIGLPLKIKGMDASLLRCVAKNH